MFHWTLNWMGKTATIVVAAFSFSIPGTCQTKVSEIRTYASGDTCLWYKWRSEDRVRMALTNLQESVDSLRIRFWTPTAAIEVWQNGNYSGGQQTLFTYSKASPNRRTFSVDQSRHFHRTTTLDSVLSGKIVDLFIDLQVHDIPEQDSIPGWRSGFDGITYIIEWSDSATYTFRDYWTPSSFPEISEARTIQTLTRSIEELLHLRAAFDSFIGTLPKGCYSDGGMYVCTGLH
jgi:hypothetical protein